MPDSSERIAEHILWKAGLTLEGGTCTEEGDTVTLEGGTYTEEGVHEVGFDLTEWLVFDDHKMMLLFLRSHESTEPRLLAQPAHSDVIERITDDVT